MAGQTRHLKVKGGRFYARLAVPARLRQIIGKTELITPLGGERRAAIKALPAAVATLQRQLDAAEGKATINRLDDLRSPITTQDYGRAVWLRYQAMLETDDATRAAYPSPDQIKVATERAIERIQRERIDITDPLAMLDVSLDVQVMKEARAFDQNARKAKLAELRKHLTEGETALIGHEVNDFLSRNSLIAPEGSAERAVLAKQIIRAEIEALQRSLERDGGDYGGKPADPIVRPPAGGIEALKPVNIKHLWRDYVQFRTAAGFMKDGGRRAEVVIENLCKFLRVRMH